MKCAFSTLWPSLSTKILLFSNKLLNICYINLLRQDSYFPMIPFKLSVLSISLLLCFSSILVASESDANENGTKYINEPASEFLSQTWYVLQNGDWSDPTTWTLDAGVAPIPNNPMSETPGAGDQVIIRNGRTVTVQSTTNNLSLVGIEIDGTLDITTSSGHNFNQIDGSGVIRMSGNSGASNFPLGTTTGSNGFGNVANGGLLLVEGTGLTFDTDRTFKDVRINMNNATAIVSLGSNLTINGNFDVRLGTFQFGDGTALDRTLDVIGDFVVENNGTATQDGRVTTAVFSNTRHELNLFGDFLNEGTVQLSDRTVPDFTVESTNGVVDFNLIATNRDQRIDCNGPTYFYRIEINKNAIDFTAFIQADDPANFVLTGYASEDLNTDVTIPNDNPNAFGLVTGAVSLGTNVQVRLNTAGNYAVGTNASLIVSGGEVTKTGVSATAALAPYGTVEVTNGVLEVPTSGGITLQDNGQISISGGEIWTTQIRTSDAGVSAQGGYQQTGGSVNILGYTNAESPADVGDAQTPNADYARFCLTYEGNAFTMTGGSLNVKDATASGLIFINSDPSNTNVSGGTVNAYSTVTGNSIIASDAPFWNLNISNESSETTARISSETLTCGPIASVSDQRTITNPNVIVLNDLNIGLDGTTPTSVASTLRTAGVNTYGSYLDLCPSGNCVDLTVGGSLRIEDSGVLDVFSGDLNNANSASVTFNSTKSADLYVGDITTYTESLTQYDPAAEEQEGYLRWELPFYNLSIDKPNATLFLRAKDPSFFGTTNPFNDGYIVPIGEPGAGGKNMTRWGSNLVLVSGIFNLSANTILNQIDRFDLTIGYSLRLVGTDITNEGTFFVFEDRADFPINGLVKTRKDAGDMNVNTIEGSTFGNLRVNIGGDILSFSSDVFINRLEYRHGRIDIGIHNLRIDILDYNPAPSDVITIGGGDDDLIFSEQDMIMMSGNTSDGGLSIKVDKTTDTSYPSYIGGRADEYNSDNWIWFPIGTDAGGERYTPAVCYINNPGVYSGNEYITIRVSDNELQTTNLSGGDLLSYYWNVDFEGFDDAGDALPTVSWLFQYDNADVVGNEANYVPGKVLNGGMFDRSDEGSTLAVRDGGSTGNDGDIIGNSPRNIIVFNGVGSSASPVAVDDIDGANDDVFQNGPVVDNDWEQAFSIPIGFMLERANYTAGVPTRFDGAPRIYYTRKTNRNANDRNRWNERSSWSLFSIDDIGTTTVEGFIKNAGLGNPEAGQQGPAIDNSIPLPGSGDIVVFQAHDVTSSIPEADGTWDQDDETHRRLRMTVYGAPTGGGGLNDFDKNTQTEVAAAIFQEDPDGPGARETARVFLREGTSHSWDELRGSGEIQLFFSNTTGNGVPTFNTDNDLGDFLNDEISLWNVKYQGNGGGQRGIGNAVTLPAFPSTFPNLRIAANGNSNPGGSDGWGNQFIMAFPSDINVNGTLQIQNRAALWVQSDMTILGNLEIGKDFQNGRFRFDNGDTPHLVTIFGDVIVGEDDGNDDDDSFLDIESSGTGTAVHTLRVGGNIQLLENTGGDQGILDLRNGNADDANVILELFGTGINNFTNQHTIVPDLYQLVINKGNDITNTFSVDTEVTIPTPVAISAQPIEILNGLLILNAANIDVTLTNDAQGDFLLPNTLNETASSGSGGLEIAQGTARIEGSTTGMLLDGLLRISGGTLDMSNTVGDDNFIQYGVSDQAIIELSSGSLLVGSQVRRPLTTTSGALNYRQTGGAASFGLTAAPQSTRGVFEVVGTNSEFIHTNGSFTIVRQNNSTTVGSLIVQPGTIDVTGSTITIGSLETPANQNSIGIDANVMLNNLNVTSNMGLTVKTYNAGLEVQDLDIDAGGTFDANGFNLSIGGNYVNDGAFISNGTDINQQLTTFASNAAQSITGTGISSFFNLEKSGTGALTVGKDITVDDDLSVLSGTISTGTFAVNVGGDMLHESIHESAPVGPGILFNGSDVQNLSTTTDLAEFGVLSIDNANGLIITGTGTSTFTINEKIVLASGVFNIGGNLLVMNDRAFFENGSGGTNRNDFNVNNMVTVNASIVDTGVRKIYNDSDADGTTFLYPLGLNFYTPVEVNITDITGNLGNDGEITVKPIDNIAGGIPDDQDEDCIDEATGSPNDGSIDFVDLNNILQFYWDIGSTNITDFDGSFFLYHVDELESVDNAVGLGLANYAPARLLDNGNLWDKTYTQDLFDEVNNVSRFQASTGVDFENLNSATISGTYTAGITRDNSDNPLCGGAIPDVVPVYITNASGSGDVDAVSSYSSTPGGNAPSVGESPDLQVEGDFTLNLTDEFWRFRRVDIASGATLTINGSGVNLGTLTGEGTLKLVNTNALPAGDYASFEANEGCTTGGGLELEVTSGLSRALPFAALNGLRRLILSGAGTKTVPNGTSYDICENLEILGGGTLTMGDNTAFNIQGNLIKASGATFEGDFPDARIVMEGSAPQQIDGVFTELEAINSLEIDNSAGLTILNATNDDVEVDQLILTEGIVTTDLDNSLIVSATGSITGRTGLVEDASDFDATTHIDGPLVRRLEETTDEFLFPVGDNGIYLPLEVSNTDNYTGASTKSWTVQYHDEDPTTSSRITNVNNTTDFTTWDGEPTTATGFNSDIFRQDLFEVEVPSDATADMRPYWDGDSDVGADADSWENLRVMAWSATRELWESYGNANPSYAGMSASSGSVISDTELSFSTNFITLGINEPILLPVELIYFTGKAEENDVLLSWATSVEINNDYFEVQRSVDGINFEVIGIVDGNGDSNEEIEYRYTDSQPYLGLSYYRLRQVDFDGAFEIHPTIQIENDFVRSGIEVTTYPNPTSPDNLNLRIESGDDNAEIVVRIIGLSGMTYYQKTFEGALLTDEKVTPKQELIPGIYFMLVEQAGNIKRHKILIR